MDYNYDGIAERIQKVYSSCSANEQQHLKQILIEMSKHGYSQTLEELWLADFKEVPVSIDEFICNPYYLGESNNNGASVYPFWRDMLRDLFGHGNRYNEICLSGGTRIGKSSTAVTIMAYMLYRLMIYRNPHQYFHKKPVSRFTIAFANLTKDLAEGVAFHEFNTTLQASGWFNDHGSFNKSVQNPIFIPEGNKIDIVPASDAAHILGMQVWACLKGDTEILTTDGIKKIEECAGTTQTILQLIDNKLVPTDAEVKLTRYCDELIRIELEDGSVIEGTPDHRIMLSDGTYKELGQLTSSDDLKTFNLEKEVDEMNLKNKDAKFIVYEHVSPKGKRYIGITSKEPSERWLNGGKGYKDNFHFWSAITQYGWDNFEHNILAADLSLEDACRIESDLIARYDTMNPDKGYNHTTGGNWSIPDEETKRKLSTIIKERCSNPEYRKKMSERLLGHTVSDDTRRKISEANTGRKFSDEICQKRRLHKHSPETIAKLKSYPGWCKGLTKETDSRVKRISESLTNRELSQEQKDKLSASKKALYKNGYSPVWINNGKIETTIQKHDIIPEGFVYGRLGKKDTYIYKDNESKKISHTELDRYIAQGWKKGRPEYVSCSIKQSLQRMHWEYNGLHFDTSEDLAKYLNNHGYPEIVGSTITSLCLKGFEGSKKYYSLAGKIRKVIHEN